MIVPAKPPALAKTRLTASGVPSADAFAVAFLQDVLAAALASDRFAAALVVTEDDGLREVVEARGGTVVLPPVRSGTSPIGIGPAVLHAARRADEVHGAGARAVVAADLPALRPGDLAAALDEANGLDRPAFVTDAAGTGTTLLTAASSAALQPCFGHRSALRHRALGHLAIRSPDHRLGPEASAITAVEWIE